MITLSYLIRGSTNQIAPTWRLVFDVVGHAQDWFSGVNADLEQRDIAQEYGVKGRNATTCCSELVRVPSDRLRHRGGVAASPQ
ncbi:unnamed protein product [Nezara viridula]|uniref:Uncharacterized protein n=1 Tax=Nezara viridula TaxID=85310 RepID=A0A9P0MTD2_NEZVI|nr:unnamed protein product [Nezara viridula]